MYDRCRTYANHGGTKDTENAQSVFGSFKKNDLRASFVFFVALWLTYGNA